VAQALRSQSLKSSKAGKPSQKQKSNRAASQSAARGFLLLVFATARTIAPLIEAA